MAFIDDFTGGTTGNELTTGTPSGGTAWTKILDNRWKYQYSTNAIESADLGTPAGDSIYTCDDQGDADQYVICKASGFADAGNYVSNRINTTDFFVGIHRFGTGGAGRRLIKAAASSSVTNLITSQGVSEEWLKIESEGTDHRFYAGGTGATPTWVQVGSTITDTDISATETGQGLFSTSTASGDYIDYFEAGALGGAATPTYTLTAAKGAYSLSGKAAALTASRKLTAAKGSYSYTGYAAGLFSGRRFLAEKGSYALTGQDATLKASRKLVADKGSYALTGQDATLKATRVLTAEKGGYSLTGYAATLTYTPVSGPTYTLTAAKGSYALTGQAAVLKAARVLTADNGSYSLSGYSATLSYSGDAAEDAWTFAGGPFAGSAFSGEQVEAVATVNDTVTLSAVSDTGSLVALTTVEAEIFTALSETTELQSLITTGFSDPRPFFWPSINGYQIKPLVDPLDQMHFLTVGTDTAKQVASDSGFTQLHTNPVTVDRFGNIPSVFVDSASEYRFILKNRYGVTKWEAGSYTWPNTVEDHFSLPPISETNTLVALTTSEP